MKPLISLIVASATAGMLALACGDGGPPDPAQLYDESGKEMRALTAFHIAGEVEGG